MEGKQRSKVLLSYRFFTPILSTLWLTVLFVVVTTAAAAPVLDQTQFHTWDEVETYLNAIANDPELSDIVELIPIGHTREGKSLSILRISKEGVEGKDPDEKAATLIMGAHHAREHVSKEAVLALIDKLINGYGNTDEGGIVITYLVDAGTFYLLPWVNPDGGMSEWLYSPEQRKTNHPLDEPQIGGADCDTCGDGLIDEDSPDIAAGDVGEESREGRTISFANNGIIGRHLQYWYENDDYSIYVNDDRSNRVQPAGGAADDPDEYEPFTFSYEGVDPDADGLYAPYSGEDFSGGVDPNRNYGSPLWGECKDNAGCSWLSGAQTYCGPAPFSEPETAAVAAFLQAHTNIVTLESLHSGINEVYPPWWLYPDNEEKTHMDESYHDSIAQYISEQTDYSVIYGGPYSVIGDTTSYSYIGSSLAPELELEFFPGGILSMTTEIYGMGSTSGSAEAIQDWFPFHWQEFDNKYPQGLFLTWSEFPWCTTCDPTQMPGPRSIWDYVQYTEYFVFTSLESCGGETDADIFKAISESLKGRRAPERPKSTILTLSEHRGVSVQNLDVFRTGVTVSQASCGFSRRTPCGQPVDFAVDGDRVDSPWTAARSW